jgi:Xaa-Pro aminopeptidase
MMDELAEKRARLLAWMAGRGLEAVVLTRIANFAWYTAGLEPVVMLSSERAEAALVITPDRSWVVCNSVELPRLRDEDQLERLGFEFHVSPWYQRAPQLEGLTQGKRWAADWPLPGALEVSGEVARLRFQLTAPEIERYREVGAASARALEEAARRVKRGMTEMEVAGMLAAQAMKERVTPTLLLVGADDRILRFRHPIPTARPIDAYAMLVLCGRGGGLVASCTRLVHFGRLGDDLQIRQQACAHVDAAFNSGTRVGAPVAQVFAQGAQAYTDAGFPDEWQKHNQGGAAGYESRDYEATPTCDEIVLAEQAFAWNPSITGVKSEDTMLVHLDGVEFLTVTGDWPSIRIQLADQDWDRPAILIR